MEASRMHYRREGQGPKLLLVHGLGSNSESWSPILESLAEHREVIAVDLPGHGRTPSLAGPTTVASLADALESFIADEQLEGIDLVGSSVGARLVLELARRGSGGAVVALDPGGFWNRAGAFYLGVTLGASIRLVRLLGPLLPTITASALGRSALLVQLSIRPWRIEAGTVLAEMRSFAATEVFDEVLRDLVAGPQQQGMPAGSARRPVVIVWGRRDRVTLARQARRAMDRFPDAELHWLERCGHFPHWDRPQEAVQLILDATRADDHPSEATTPGG